MRQRCHNSKNRGYKNYGARGITVCDEWLDKEAGFMNFYNWAMQNGYQDGLSIDRINTDGNYEPSNCRWVDMKTQNNNKRNNVYITYKDTTKTLKGWSDYLGINYKCLESRLRSGWSTEKLLMTPVKGSNNDK